jgi:hypothetical protein
MSFLTIYFRKAMFFLNGHDEMETQAKICELVNFHQIIPSVIILNL